MIDNPQLETVHDDNHMSTELKDYLNHHILACCLLGEAKGMMHSLYMHVQSSLIENHSDNILSLINIWSDKVDEFVKLEKV